MTGNWGKHDHTLLVLQGGGALGEDVAEAALFLAALKTKPLTGQSLIVSHGWFME